MKKHLLILLMLATLLLLAGCFGDGIRNIDKGFGNVIISGKWAGHLKSSDNASRTIYANAGSIKIVLTKNSQELSQTVTRDSSSDSFYIEIDNVEVGDWSMTLVIYDSDGDEVARKTGSVTVASGDNPVSVLVTLNDYTIGPQNYAELFLQNALAKNFSLISSQYEAITYLGVSEIDVYLADAYIRTGTYNYHTDFLAKNQLFNWDWPNVIYYEIGTEDVDSTYVSTSSDDIVASMEYSYSDDYVIGATYTNSDDFEENRLISYNSSGKISQVEILVEKASDSSSEKLIYTYEGCLLTELASSVNGTPMTLTYSGEDLLSNVEKDEDNNTVRERSYTWSSGNIVSSTDKMYDVNDYDSDSNTTEIRWERDSTYTYGGDYLISVTNLDEILLTGSENYEKEEITYTYDSSNKITGITVDKYHYEDSAAEDYDNDGTQGYYLSNLVQIDFTYDDDDLVRKVEYFYTAYDYSYNSGTSSYDRTDTENLVFYEMIYYTSDDGSDVTIGVQ